MRCRRRKEGIGRLTITEVYGFVNGIFICCQLQSLSYSLIRKFLTLAVQNDKFYICRIKQRYIQATDRFQLIDPAVWNLSCNIDLSTLQLHDSGIIVCDYGHIDLIYLRAPLFPIIIIFREDHLLTLVPLR